MQPLLLIDGSSYIYRAFHALPDLETSQGHPTGATYGIISMIKKLSADYPTDRIAVIFDSKGKTFRHHLYTEYKANRTGMPDSLRLQLPDIHALITAMGIPIIMVEGVEADDVIGTLAKKASDNSQPVVISTGDKDMAQIVNTHITLINTMNNRVLTEKAVSSYFGVTPHQMIDYLALIGDASDNVPGVHGIGPKTAAKWLSDYQTLENIILHREQIPMSDKVRHSFNACIDQFPLMKTLLTLKCDIHLETHLEDLHCKPPNIPTLKALLKKLEFKTWLAEISQENAASPRIPMHYPCILEKTALQDLIHRLEKTSLFSIDTETTSLHIIDAQIVGLSFGFAPTDAYYLPLAHDYPGAPQQLNREETLALLKPLLENKHIHKITHHGKYDLNVFKNHGIELQGLLFDTMLESYVLDSTATRHNMDSLAQKYLDKKTILFEEVAGKGSKQLSFNQVGLTEATEYAAEDADITLQLHQFFWPKLENNPDALKTFQEIEMPLTQVLAAMERTGVLIDTTRLKVQSEKLAQRLSDLEKAAHEEVEFPFNLSSPKQLQDILYTTLGLPVIEKTPKGQPSTAESTLQVLASTYTLPKIILEHRTLSKLKSTYTDKLPEEVHPKTHRIHTSYHQAVASTGRLSSSHPNLQNIPIKTEEGRQIRKAFIAPQDYKILAADYSQIELRLMAHVAQDKSLLDAFHHNLDIHSATAAEIFNTSLTQVTAEQRRHAKTINFGLIYGMSSFGLSKQLGISVTLAQNYIDTYFQRYPGVKAYMENIKKLAHEKKYVTTLFGRQLYLPTINDKNLTRQRAAERAAINAPLQGSAADLIKLAMIEIHHWLTTENIPAAMIMQVHDELVFEVKEEYADNIAKDIQHRMENVVKLSIPLLVSIGIGNNWDEAH